jgi:hypothetical protein
MPEEASMKDGDGMGVSKTQPVGAPKPGGQDSPRASFDGSVRVGPVFAVPKVLADLGANPRRVFVRAGVPFHAFKNPENRIAMEALGRLLMECALETNCSHFGLLVGKRFDLKGLGAIGYLMRNSATVGEALRALLLHLHVHDRGAAPVMFNVDASTVLVG